MFSVLIVISVYDLRHKVIPDKLVFAFILVSFFSIFINPYIFGPIIILPSLSAFISGPIISLPFVLIWFFSRGRLMGLGDGKLALGLGWMLGLSEGVFAMLLAFCIGSVVSLSIMFLSKAMPRLIKSKKISMKTEIPLAPFLITGAFITFLFNLDIFSLINFFGM